MASPSTETHLKQSQEAAEEARINGRISLAHAREAMRNTMYDAGKSMRTTVEAAGVRLDSARIGAEDQIRRKPLASAAIAFGVGYVLSRLLAPRRY